MEYARNYFPDTYSDFSVSSPGAMFMEMVAYVGDILSFYQDINVQETFLQYAKNPANLYAIAYMMGYRPKVSTVATVELQIQQIVNGVLVSGSYRPDWNKAYRIAENTVVQSASENTIPFLIKEPVDFSYSSSYDPTGVEVYKVEDGIPTFILTKKTKAYSGEIKTFSKTFSEYKKYQTITIEDQNIIGILNATDSEGKEWFEVPFLGQDTIFVDIGNTSEDSNVVPYVLTLKKVPYRFVTRFNKDNNLEIQFGAGIYAEDADEKSFLPNPTSLESDIQELSSDRYDVAYDPSNYLFSKSYGLAPIDTTITFKYVIGGGVESNVPANTIVELQTPENITCKDGSDVDISTISITNPEAASGGRDGDTLEEIRQNALRTFSEQKRVVTLKDFNIRALAMPSKYGSVAKVYAVNESLLQANNVSILEKNPLAITLYVLAFNNEGKLVQASKTIKSNLKTYLSEYLMLTDALDIRDAYVINLGVNYDIVVKTGFDTTAVLLECNRALQEFFSIEKRSINETLNIAEAYNILNQIKGVQVVKSIELENKSNDRYSEYSYDVNAALRNNILYPSYDPCIFEIKYPEIDIKGRVTTLQ